VTRSRRVDAIRRASEEADPQRAAERATRRFERDAVPIPSTLRPDQTAAPWTAQQYVDAQELYRDIATAGPDGIELRHLRGGERREAALKVLRASGAVSESMEPRHDAAGRHRTLVVLRVAGV
jgi:hypothetical protein